MKSKRAKSDPGSIGIPKWVRIVGIRFDDDTNQAKYRVRFTNEEGDTKYEDIDKQDFLQRGQVLRTLARLNARMPPKPKEDLEADILATERHANKNTKHMTACTGWTAPTDQGESFVYYGQTFGALRSQLIHKGTDQIDPYLGKQMGSIKGWRALRPAFEKSDYLIFAASIPAVGPLLAPLGHDEGVVYHFHGSPNRGLEHLKSALKSSSGKTTAARVALSAIGKCIGPLQSPDTSKRGLEEYCAAHNHLVVVLDDDSRTSSGAANSVPKAELAYFLANGSGRRRAAMARQLPNLMWLLPVITNGEDPLENPFDREIRREGAKVRMVPIPVPPGVKGGIFNRVTSKGNRHRKECRRLARSVRRMIAANYGVVMPAFLGKLVYGRARWMSKVQALVGKFMTEIGPCNDPWERRFAEKFAIVYAAAVLLAAFGIAPWSEKRAMDAVKHLYQLSRAASVREDEATDAFVARVGKLRAQNAFPYVPKGSGVRRIGEQRPQGIIRRIGHHHDVIVIPHEQFKRLVEPPAAHDLVERELDVRGMLLRGNDGKRTRQVMVDGLTSSARPRCLCVLLPVKSLKAIVRGKPPSRPGHLAHAQRSTSEVRRPRYPNLH